MSPGTKYGDTLVFTDPKFLDHDPGPGHVESPARLDAIMGELGARANRRRPHRDAAGRDRRRDRGGPQPRLSHAAGAPGTASTRSSIPTRRSRPGAGRRRRWRPAPPSARVEAVMNGRAANAFALVRPPGHHARPAKAMGFCLINNAAVRGRGGPARGRRRGCSSSTGTSTTATGRRRSSLGATTSSTCRSHQYPFYPGTGASEEIGVGAGKGATVNCPLPAGQDDADYGAVFHDLFLPVGRAFAPDLIIVSAGYDAHRARSAGRDARHRARVRGDDVARSPSCAGRTCGGKLVLLLEGGYDLGALAASVRASLEALTGRREDFPLGAGTDPALAVAATRDALRAGWANRSQDVTMKVLRWPPWTFGVGGVRSGRLASRLLALDRPRGLGVARQPGARPPWQPRSAAGRRADGGRARRRAGRLLRPADAVLAISFGRPARRRDDGRRGAGGGGALRVASAPLLCAVDRALPLVRDGGSRLPVVPVGQPAARVRACWRRSFRPTRPAPLVHFLFRLVLFKLYFESGVAKWQSDLGDWQDGSAMTYYYETAPLPTWLAFTAHHLPVWWHHLESRATLALELAVPFLIFGPRPSAPLRRVRLFVLPDLQRRHRQLRLLLLPRRRR